MEDEYDEPDPVHEAQTQSQIKETIDRMKDKGQYNVWTAGETVVSEETNLMDLLKTDEEVSDVVKKSRDKDNSIFKPIQLGKNITINPMDTSIEWQTKYGDFGVDIDPLKSAATATYGFKFKKGGLLDRKRS